MGGVIGAGPCSATRQAQGTTHGKWGLGPPGEPGWGPLTAPMAQQGAPNAPLHMCPLLPPHALPCLHTPCKPGRGQEETFCCMSSAPVQYTPCHLTRPQRNFMDVMTYNGVAGPRAEGHLMGGLALTMGWPWGG